MNSSEGIDILEALGFQEKKDIIGSYCNKNRIIYFLKIHQNEFIVFSPNSFDKKNQPQNFDCWIDKYGIIDDIGVIPPIESKILKYSFDFEKHYELLKQYLPKKK